MTRPDGYKEKSMNGYWACRQRFRASLLAALLVSILLLVSCSTTPPVQPTARDLTPEQKREPIPFPPPPKPKSATMKGSSQAGLWRPLHRTLTPIPSGWLAEGVKISI